MAAITFRLAKCGAGLSLRQPQAIDVSLRMPQAVNIQFEFVVRDGGDPYDGPYAVTPRFAAQVLPTDGKTLRDDVTVDPINVARVSNPAGGNTIYIGGMTNG